MRYLQNMVLLISVLGAAPAVLAAASCADVQPLQAFQPQDDDAEYDDDDEGLTGNYGVTLLAQLEYRARVKCLTKGRPGKNCYYSQCPGSKQCKVNVRGNCMFKYTQKKRPFGCSLCLCYRSSM
ncbi:uncharacterized protein FIESC28_00971 [Fusarium coffeatum]|uniref:Uncharacterized protein n=1 Tax=Fusarium coffeatum TaxID=231269 RepID=A0A366SB96_9HYPO|nr:uncharacterized protein FIESC28_00971 [Fusarium coffeatum]RBR26188.1 hypothetical protein FIESC28_00971 [Fusarium coffeatum]